MVYFFDAKAVLVEIHTHSKPSRSDYNYSLRVDVPISSFRLMKRLN